MPEIPPASQTPPTSETGGEYPPAAKAALLARASYALVAIREIQQDDRVHAAALEEEYPFTVPHDPDHVETRAGYALLRMQRTLLHASYGENATMEPQPATQSADESNPYLGQLRSTLADIGLYDTASGQPTPIVDELAEPIKRVALQTNFSRAGDPLDIVFTAASQDTDSYGAEFGDALSTEFGKMRELYGEHGEGAMDVKSFDDVATRARGVPGELTPGVITVPLYDELIVDHRYSEVVERLTADLHALAGVGDQPIPDL